MNRTPIFDAVRKILKGRDRKPVFHQFEVDALDAAIDAAMRETGEQLAGEFGQNPDFDQAVLAHLELEEGRSERAYRDHLGWWTIGIGRLIDPRKGGRITPDEEAILIANDPSRKPGDWHNWVLTDPEIDMLKLNDIDRFVSEISQWPAWKAVEGNVARQVALTSLAFQLGIDGLRQFKNSLRMVEEKRFSDAAANFLKSKWAQQTPERAKRVTDMIRTGELAT